MLFEDMGFAFSPIENNHLDLPRVMGEADYAGIILTGDLDLLEATILFVPSSSYQTELGLAITVLVLTADPNLVEIDMNWMWNAFIAGDEEVSRVHGNTHMFAARLSDGVFILNVRPKGNHSTDVDYILSRDEG